MAISDVSICNTALITLGEDPIASFDDDVKAARLCNSIYEDTRDAVLRDAKWNFALERVELALLTTTPEFEFSNQFQLPADCIRVVYTDDDLAPYRIEGNKLLTDSSSVKILYVKQVTDPVQFDTTFRAALSARLAMEMAIPLTDSESRFQTAAKLYEEKISIARGMDAQENGSIEVFEADEWINARGGVTV